MVVTSAANDQLAASYDVRQMDLDKSLNGIDLGASFESMVIDQNNLPTIDLPKIPPPSWVPVPMDLVHDQADMSDAEVSSAVGDFVDASTGPLVPALYDTSDAGISHGGWTAVTEFVGKKVDDVMQLVEGYLADGEGAAGEPVLVFNDISARDAGSVQMASSLLEGIEQLQDRLGLSDTPQGQAVSIASASVNVLSQSLAAAIANPDAGMDHLEDVQSTFETLSGTLTNLNDSSEFQNTDTFLENGVTTVTNIEVLNNSIVEDLVDGIEIPPEYAQQFSILIDPGVPEVKPNDSGVVDLGDRFINPIYIDEEGTISHEPPTDEDIGSYEEPDAAESVVAEGETPFFESNFGEDQGVDDAGPEEIVEIGEIAVEELDFDSIEEIDQEALEAFDVEGLDTESVEEIDQEPLATVELEELEEVFEETVDEIDIEAGQEILDTAEFEELEAVFEETVEARDVEGAVETAEEFIKDVDTEELEAIFEETAEARDVEGAVELAEEFVKDVDTEGLVETFEEGVVELETGPDVVVEDVPATPWYERPVSIDLFKIEELGEGVSELYNEVLANAGEIVGEKGFLDTGVMTGFAAYLEELSEVLVDVTPEEAEAISDILAPLLLDLDQGQFLLEQMGLTDSAMYGATQVMTEVLGAVFYGGKVAENDAEAGAEILGSIEPQINLLAGIFGDIISGFDASGEVDANLFNFFIDARDAASDVYQSVYNLSEAGGASVATDVAVEGTDNEGS